MNRSLAKVVLCIVAIGTAACNAASENADGQAQSQTDQQVAPGGAAGDPAVVHHPDVPARPTEKTDSIQGEGVFQKFTARLVEPNSDLRFSTYVPADMIFEQASAGEGEGFFFYSNFAGKRNDNAFVLLFVLPDGATEADAQKLANAFVISRKQLPSQVAHTRLGSHDGRHFYWAETYPGEFGDGMGPRSAYIRRQWIWLNDGKSLESTLQPRP
jgi:hypothetical protein